MKTETKKKVEYTFTLSEMSIGELGTIVAALTDRVDSLETGIATVTTATTRDYYRKEQEKAVGLRSQLSQLMYTK